MLNKEQKDLLYSLALGDGCIYKDTIRNRYQLSIGHGPKQKDYCAWKLCLLNNLNLFKKDVLLHRQEINDKRNGKTYIQYHFKKTSPLFKELWDDYHSDDRVQKILRNIHSDRSLAIWFMDDGATEKHKSKKKSIDGEQLYIRPAFHLCTHCFTEEENKQMADWFKRRYLVEPKIAHDNRRDIRYSFLRFSAIDTEKIYKIIRPYVLQIESMKEKFKFIEDFYFPN